MNKEKHPEFTESISKPIKREDAVFQIKYLIMKNDFEGAHNILKVYDLSMEDLLSFNLSIDIDSFMTFLKSRI